ncbi:hypothetical protein ES703_121441 [subsurface metagenome]
MLPDSHRKDAGDGIKENVDCHISKQEAAK